MTQEENLHNNVQNNEENINPQESCSEEAGSTESYAVRPHHRQRRLIEYDGRDKMFKVRNTLNIIFMILAVIGLILWTQTDWQNTGISIVLVGVALKIVEVLLRLFKK